jgi:hypothetical protein
MLLCFQFPFQELCSALEAFDLRFGRLKFFALFGDALLKIRFLDLKIVGLLLESRDIVPKLGDFRVFGGKIFAEIGDLTVELMNVRLGVVELSFGLAFSLFRFVNLFVQT